MQKNKIYSLNSHFSKFKNILTDPATGRVSYESCKQPIQFGKDPSRHKFKKRNGRSFRRSWYITRDWLEYSISLDRTFCFNCRLFSTDNANSTFTINGYCDWKHAARDFYNHSESTGHKNATILLKSRIENDINKTSINAAIENYRAELVEKNRQYLRHLITSVIFLAKQGLALRGHREIDDSLNRGNFLELIELRSNELSILKDKSIQFKYVSPDNQNEIIDLLAAEIKRAIVSEVQNKPFSIIVDETPDIANHEQISFCIRYSDDQLKVMERFIEFIKTESTTGDELERLVEGAVKALGLSAKTYLVGQGYDGGSNMSGCFKGLASRIKDKIPQAL